MRLTLRSRLTRVIGTGALVGALLLPAAAPVAAADPVILKAGTIESLRSLNPYQSAYFPDYETFQLNFNLLVDFGPNLEPVPGFADTWERAADGKSWVFHIRDGMKWSDGTPATSADACFSYGLDIDAINNDTNVGNGYIDPSLKDARVTKAECPDPETMILYTDDGTTKILKTYIPILPKHIYGTETYETIGENPFTPPIVGTGQYQVVEYTEDQLVHLKRNPNYWGDRKGFADEVYIQIFKTADTMVQALKNGDIDYARGIGVDQFAQLKTEPNIQTVAGKSNGWIELGFNSYGTGTGKTIKGGGPSTTALQDTAFRDALGYAIDKQVLLDKTLGGHGDIATTNVPPVLINEDADPPFAWHTDPANPRTFDLAVARQKLDAAGYVLDASGQRLDKDKKPLRHSGPGNLDEGHEVHALVLGLLHQRADPAVVVDHATQALQVGGRRAHHARHGRNRLKDDRPVAIALGEQGVGEEAQQAGQAQRKAVRQIAGRPMRKGWKRIDRHRCSFAGHHC